MIIISDKRTDRYTYILLCRDISQENGDNLLTYLTVSEGFPAKRGIEFGETRHYWCGVLQFEILNKELYWHTYLQLFTKSCMGHSKKACRT